MSENKPKRGRPVGSKNKPKRTLSVGVEKSLSMVLGCLAEAAEKEGIIGHDSACTSSSWVNVPDSVEESTSLLGPTIHTETEITPFDYESEAQPQWHQSTGPLIRPDGGWRQVSRKEIPPMETFDPLQTLPLDAPPLSPAEVEAKVASLVPPPKFQEIPTLFTSTESAAPAAHLGLSSMTRRVSLGFPDSDVEAAPLHLALQQEMKKANEDMQAAMYHNKEVLRTGTARFLVERDEKGKFKKLQHIGGL